LEPLDEVRAVANRLGRHVGIVRHIAHLLDTDSPARQVKRVLRTYLNRLEDTAPRRGRGAITGRFADHVVALSNRYWPGLFHPYDHPQIPRTTSALEGFFGSSKRGVRQTTGRKSTAGGRIESCAEAVVRVQALIESLPPEQLRENLRAVLPDKYRDAKQRLSSLRQPAQERRSIQRDPQRYLHRLLNDWLDSS